MRSSASRGSKRTGVERSRQRSMISCKRGPPAPRAIRTRSNGRPPRRASRTGWTPIKSVALLDSLGVVFSVEPLSVRIMPSMADPAVQEDRQEIPDKLYFRIGDVSRLAGIKPYVLRFWETEFPGLGPKKSGTGHRLFRRKDVELVLEIKRLLYEQRFTIEGARKHLEERGKPEEIRSAGKRDGSKKKQPSLFYPD